MCEGTNNRNPTIDLSVYGRLQCVHTYLYIICSSLLVPLAGHTSYSCRATMAQHAHYVRCVTS